MCCVRRTFPSRIIHSSCSLALICCHRWEGITNSSVLFQTQQTMVIIHKQKGTLQGKSQHVIKFRFRGALKAAARLSAAGRSGARNTGDGAQVAFQHYLPNQSATPRSSQWASTMCTCQIIASNALGADASDRQRRPSAQQTARPALECTDSLLSSHLPVIIQIQHAWLIWLMDVCSQAAARRDCFLWLTGE